MATTNKRNKTSSAQPAEQQPEQINQLQNEVDALKKTVAQQGTMIDLSEKARSWLRISQSGMVSAYRSTTFTGNGFFSPGEPVLAVDPETEPRLFQYGVNDNLISIPRAMNGILSFQVLRNLSMMCQEIRLNIQKVKETIRGLEWDIVFEGEEIEMPEGSGIYIKATPDTERIKNFWEKPDGVHTFDAFLVMILEEVLVTDALTLYPNENPLTGDFLLELVDGTTIKPLVDFHGRQPPPPAPAFTQTLFGVPRSHYTSERLLYLPRNPRIFSLYGESPIEWIVQMVVQALKRSSMRTAYFSEGNIPGAFAGLPSEWTVNQIQEFTEWFNAAIKGDEARAFQLMFLPHSGSSLPIVQFQNTNYEDPQLDEWLMTIACWAFGNSPSEFGLTRGEGLGGAGYMEGGENAQYRGSISSTCQFLATVFNYINKTCLKAPWAKFKWVGLETPEDSKARAEVHTMYIDKVYTADYVADKLGVPEKYRVKNPLGGLGIAPELAGMFQPTVPPVPNPNNPAPPAGARGVSGAPGQENAPAPRPQPPARKMVASALDDREINREFSLLRERALRFAKRGWKYDDFESKILPVDIVKSLNLRLSSTRSPEEIRKIVQESRESYMGKTRGDSHPFAEVIDPIEEEMKSVLIDHYKDLQSRILKVIGEQL